MFGQGWPDLFCVRRNACPPFVRPPFVLWIIFSVCLLVGFAFPACADLPVPVKSPQVQVSSPKAARDVYAPGDAADIAVKVKNKSEYEIEAFILLDIVQPDGAIQQMQSEIQTVGSHKSKSVSVQYPIPADAPDGTYYARVYIRNPYIREPYYVDDAVKIFEVHDGRALESEVKVEERLVGSDFDWPGAVQLPEGPVASIPFAPTRTMAVSTLTPEFTWPVHPQAVSYKVYVSRVPLSGANTILAEGVTDVKFAFDPADASAPLVDGRSYAFTVLPKDGSGNTLVDSLDGFFSTFTVQTAPLDTSAVSDPAADLLALKQLLNDLKNALINNDRAALMALIHPDWISTDPDFADKSKFDITMRTLFNKTTTTLATWSTENITDIISPGRRVILTCTWRQKLTHTTFNATRDINTSLRLDARKQDGRWLIREDLDKLIFTANFGMVPSVSLHGLLPPGNGTR